MIKILIVDDESIERELLNIIIEPPVGIPSKPIIVSLNFFRGTQ
jgi:hypothetical protein